MVLAIIVAVIAVYYVEEIMVWAAGVGVTCLHWIWGPPPGPWSWVPPGNRTHDGGPDNRKGGK